MKNATKAKIALILERFEVVGIVMVIGLGLVSSWKDTSYLIIVILCICLLSLVRSISKYTALMAIMTIPEMKSLYTKLTDEEKEMVEDAKSLIKKVDSCIKIADFNVYKYEEVTVANAFYNKDVDERNICISFRELQKISKDVCFMAVVYAVLDSQNNSGSLKTTFKKGLCQLLAEWLIANYSEKYGMPTELSAFPKQKEIVRKVLQESEVDMKEVFLHYINFQPEFFRKFVPKKYFNK